MLGAGAGEHQGLERNPKDRRILSHWGRAGFPAGVYLKLGQLFLGLELVGTKAWVGGRREGKPGDSEVQSAWWNLCWAVSGRGGQSQAKARVLECPPARGI